MSKNTYILTKDECYCDVVDLYDTVARRMGINDPSKLQYDCKKICTSKKVQNEVFRYYVDEMDLSPADVNVIIIHFGPKANIESDGYIVTVKDGFIIDGGDN